MHYQIARVRCGAGIHQGFRAGADYENIGGSRLLQQVGHRQRPGGTPLRRCRAPLDRSAKLRFELRQSFLDGGGLLIEELLSEIAIGEIHWRPEIRGGNADDPCPESLGDISGYSKAGIVGPVQRQPDHDGFVVHNPLQALGRNAVWDPATHSSILELRSGSKLT